MKRLPYGKYTKESRLDALKLFTDDELRILKAARRLSLAPSTFNNCMIANI